MNWLLLFVPIAIGLELLAPDRHLLVFVTSSLGLLPLAMWLGRATEQLAERMGEGVGGLLNATFGNAAELIIALVALHRVTSAKSTTRRGPVVTQRGAAVDRSPNNCRSCGQYGFVGK